MPRAHRVFLPNRLKLEFPPAVIPKARAPGKSSMSPFPPSDTCKAGALTFTIAPLPWARSKT